MKFKIGDKVKFLNEVGGGVITKIVSPSMVCVAIEEGFEYPVSTSEIIPAIQEESGSKAFNVDFNTKSTSIPKIDIPEVDSDDEDFEREIPLQKFTSLNSSKNGLYLAFIPHDQVWLLKDMIDIYIINKTSYDVIYNLFLRTEEKTYKGVDFGSISPQSRYFIETIAREELNEWCNGHFQAIFHADHIKSPLAPFNSNFQIKASRFVSKDSFVTSSFMEEKAILYFLGDCIEENIEMPSKDEIKNIDFQPKSNPKAEIIERHSFLQKFLKDADSAEVDLHIESILEESDLIQEDPESLDAIQILQIQLSHFERCLNEAIRLKLKKIIFIHGVGIGKLKGEIKKAMNKYPDIHYFEASGLKYGSGAIEVWIK